MYIPNHSHRSSLLRCLAAAVVLALVAVDPTVAQYGPVKQSVKRTLGGGGGYPPPAQERGRGTAPPSTTAKPGSETALTSDEQKKIASEQDADKLLTMAQEFLTAKKETGARLCLDRAVKLKPALLTVEKAPGTASSKEWTSFWFSYKAKQQEKQLDAKDTAGRVKIAEWLHKIGEDGTARDILKNALKINKDDAEVLKRMEEWNLSSDSGFRIDLTFGLTQPLLPDSVSDEGEKLEPRRDQRFMLIPIAYDPGDTKLLISPGGLKVKSDDDKLCRVAGLMLLMASGTVPAGSTGRAPTLQLQQASDPVFEQIEAQRSKDGAIELTTSNRVHPKSKREASTTTGGKSSREPAPRPTPGEGKQTVAGSGYAVFLVEVPMSTQSVQVICRNDPPATLPFEFLNQISKVGGEMQPSERGKLIDLLIAQTTSQAPCLASVAIAGLASIREKAAVAARESGAARPGTDRRDPATQKLEKAMLTGLENTSPQVRRETFTAFVYSPAPLFPATLSSLWTEKKTAPAMYLLDAVENILQTVPVSESPTATPAPVSGDDRLQKLMAMAAGLPPSPATANAFAVLGACLGSGIPEVFERALDMILAYPSQQSLVTLGDMPRSAAAVKTALIDRLAKVPDNQTKAAAVRIMLSMPDEGTTIKLLEACKEITTTLSGADDPILRAIKPGQSPQVLVKLVELLGRSDLSKVAGESAFADAMKTLTKAANTDAGLQAALLKLARGQFHVEYQAPIYRGQGVPTLGSSGPTAKSSASELLLATLATAPKSDTKGDPKAAREAAQLLIGAGRLAVLEEQLKQAKVDDLQQIIQNVGTDKELAKREALPIFLAHRLASQEEKVATAALNALAEVYGKADASQRWRLNLAVKSGVDAKELFRLVQSKDTKTARAAMSLIRQLGGLSAADSDQMQSAEQAAREQKYAAINEQRATKPAGVYQCVVYLDVRSETIPGQPGAEPAPPTEAGETPPMTEGVGLPLPELRLAMQPEGTQGFRVVLDGRDLTLGEGDSGGPGRTAPQPAAGPLAFKIDLAPVLLEALKKAQDQKSPFAARVNQMVLNDRVPCELKHEQLGTWGGEFQVQVAGGQKLADSETPLSITGGKIYLELVEPGK